MDCLRCNGMPTYLAHLAHQHSLGEYAYLCRKCIVDMNVEDDCRVYLDLAAVTRYVAGLEKDLVEEKGKKT